MRLIRAAAEHLGLFTGLGVATRAEPSEGERGQALVELALVVPIIVFLLLGIYDFARVFTAQIAIESAAREAADFGAFNSSRWLGDPANPLSNYSTTLQGMTERACVASINLDDYVGDSTTCTNPTVKILLTDENGGVANDCDNPVRPQGPCWVQVDLAYDFNLLIPFGVDFLGSYLGLPDTLGFERTSIFAISDFSVDQESQP